MWKPLGAVDPESLTEARLQAHWAAQLVSAVGTSRLDPAADFSHANLGWDAGRGLLAGRAVEDGRFAALRLSTLTLVVGDAEYPLDGHTLDEGLAWLVEQTGGQGLERPEHDLPSHAVGEGERFSVGDRGPALAELEAWFHDANEVIEAFAARTEDASKARCWPHHFDLATLVTVFAGEEAKSVGVGFSPGDGSYAQPYFYVTPWPYPEDPDPPALPAGAHWHTEGWFGAVLPGSAVVGAADPRAIVDAFVAAATAACRGLLG
jgi:hypothetical protein